MTLRDHNPIPLEEFNGLWKRGDQDSVPIDHFADCNNIQFIESGFETRDGLDTLIAKGNVVRMYNYRTQTEEGLLILDSNGDIYHSLLDGSDTTYGPLLSIPEMTDFGFQSFDGRAYITPFFSDTTTDEDGNLIYYQRGLQNDFVYVYLGDGTNARKAAGFPPTNSDDTPFVAYLSPIDGVNDIGIHVLGVSFSNGADESTALGTTVRPVVYLNDKRQIIVNNIPIGGAGITERKIYMTHAIDPALWDPDLTTYTYYLAVTVSDNTSTDVIVNIDDASLVTAFAAGSLPNPTSGGITAENTPDVGFCDLGLHVIGVVYETDTGYLTAPGPEVLAVCTFVNELRKIKISNIPISPDSFVTKRHLVSSKAISLYNGNDRGFNLYFIPNGTIEDNTTTELEVSYFDIELLDDASHLIDNFSEIPAGVTLTLYGSRMVLTTTYDDISLAYLSAPGEPESFDQVDGLIIFPLDGNPITTAQEYRGLLYIFKKARTSVTSDNGDVPSTWILTPIDRGIGCSIHGIGTILDSDGTNVDYLVITDFSGIFIFDGKYTRPELSWKIQDYWLALDKNLFNTLQTTVDSIKEIIYINLPSGIILIGDFKNGITPKDIRWGPWSFDVETTTIALYHNNILAIGSIDAS